MIVWKGLLRKEWKLVRVYALIAIIVSFLVPIILYSMSSYFKNQEFFYIFTGMFFFMQVFIMPTILLVSLNIEGQNQLWLHNPNKMWKLVLAKFVLSFIVFFAAFVVTNVMFDIGVYLLGYFYDVALPFKINDVLNIGFIGVSAITAISISMSIFVLFFWTIYHTLASVAPRLKSVRWPIMIGIFIIFQVLGNVIQNSAFYMNIRQLFVLKINYLLLEHNNFQITIGPSNPELSNYMAEVFLVDWIVGIVISLSLFLLSIRWLERKVEV